MLNSEHLSLVNKIGDKTEFTITRVHCTSKGTISEKEAIIDALLAIWQIAWRDTDKLQSRKRKSREKIAKSVMNLTW